MPLLHRLARALSLACPFCLAACIPAQAQLARVFTDCTIPTTLGTRDPVTLIVDQNNKLCVSGTAGTVPTTTTTGALEPPTADTGKINPISTSLPANTSTQIAPANTSRIALGIQCASGGVSVSERGVTLTAAGVGNGSIFIPPNPNAYFTPPIASRTAITAYTATAQTCTVTEYLR